MNAAQAVVEGLINSVINGNLEGVLSRVSEELVVDEPMSLTYGGVHRGKAAFLDDVIGGITEKTDMRVIDYRMLAQDNEIVVHMNLEFTAHSNGAVLEMPYVEIYTVNDGLVSRIDVYPKDAMRLREFWDAS